MCASAKGGVHNNEGLCRSFCKAATASHSLTAAKHAAWTENDSLTHATENSSWHASTHTACIHVRSMLHNLSSCKVHTAAREKHLLNHRKVVVPLALTLVFKRRHHHRQRGQFIIAKDKIYFIRTSHDKSIYSFYTKIVGPMWARGGKVQRVQHAESQLKMGG